MKLYFIRHGQTDWSIEGKIAMRFSEVVTTDEWVISLGKEGV